jgi:hypothetical protein
VRRLLLGLLVATATVMVTASAAPASTPVGEWGMSGLSDGSSHNFSGWQKIAFTGSRLAVPGVVGGAVAFTGAPSFGVAYGTEAQNPGDQNFAMGVVFTSRPIPAGVGYSGNLMQKGWFSSPGQVKLQLVPDNGGTVNCVIKGADGTRILPSTVKVDDGDWHTARCWREGSRIGLTVDGVAEAETVDVGVISNNEPVRVGNKSDTADWTDQHFGANDCAVYLIGWDARADANRLIPC